MHNLKKNETLFRESFAFIFAPKSLFYLGVGKEYFAHQKITENRGETIK